MSDRQPYKTDLSDEQWALIEPVISSWKAHASRPSAATRAAYAMREIVNALLYQGRTGCQWDYLPHDLPAARRGEVLLLQLARRRHRPDHPRPAALAGPGEGGGGRPTRAWWCSTPRACTRPPGCPPAPTGSVMRQKKSRAASAAWPLMCLGLVIAVVVAGRVRARQRRRYRAAGQGRRRHRHRARRPWSTRGSRTPSSTHGQEGRHRCRSRRAQSRRPDRVRSASQAGGDVEQRLRDHDAAPQTGARLRTPARSSAESRVYWAMSDRMIQRRLTATSAPTWRGA